MMQRSRANETRTHVRRLGSRNKNLVDAARAYLSIRGGQEVEHLIEALEGDGTRVRAHVMPLLATIQDPRGREPLIAMLLDRNANLRRIAALSLARFPSPDTVAALNRLLDGERRTNVRVAAIQALVEQYAAGQDQAIRRVLDLLLDTSQTGSIRLAAFSLLRVLPASQRRGVLARLREDRNVALRARADELHEAGPFRFDPERAAAWLEDLGSQSYDTWHLAVEHLGSSGVKIVDSLIDAMRRRAHDPDYCTRAGMALKALGPRSARALAAALERVEEPFPLQVLVEAIGAIGEKSSTYGLKDLIDRLAAHGALDGFDPCMRVRAKAHLELARVGSRVAIADLRAALADATQRVELELLAAMRLIGKRDEIALLLQAYSHEDAFVQERIAEVVRAIMKRERIPRNSRVFHPLDAKQRLALARILLVPSARGRRRRVRRARPGAS